MKKTLVSGIKPTARPHVGNYFGALKQFVDLQGTDAERFYFVASYHALTNGVGGNDLAQNTHELVLDLLAIGVDPEQSNIFLQQDVPEVTELAWIFSCLSTMPYLMRAHAFKDAEAKNKDISVGTFNYPMLMAADILIYGGSVVPVGRDQEQHVEIARDMARKFNAQFGQVFSEPEAMMMPDVAVVPGIDGQKMSKSYGNTIPLFGTDEEIQKAVMGIVTDSSGDIPANVYAIHKLFKSESELAPLYEEKKGKYKDLKEALLSDILAFIAPMRARRAEFAADPDRVSKILADGAAKARAKAQEKMAQVRRLVGLS